MSHRVFLLLLLSISPLPAGVWVHGLFTDHMVLQQEAKVRVWGWAEEGVTVRVAPGWAPDKSVSIQVGSDRQWETWLDTPKADGKSYPLTISGKDKTITINDVVFGEVWLTGGQSNMAMGMSGWKEQPILGGPADLAKANYPLIRMFRFRNGHSRTPSNNVQGGTWTVCTPESAKSYSATGFYFAREVHLKAGCPVGFIHTAVGGVRIERWIRRADLEQDDELKSIVESGDEMEQKWKLAVELAKTQGKPAPRNPHQQMPCWAYNGIIAPLRKMTIRGTVWYQGEANVRNGYQYRKLLPTMIRGWRSAFEAPRMPFLVVQIANHTDGSMPWKIVPRYEGPPRESGHAELREAQLMTARLKNVGLAVTIDIGDSHCIHPQNKRGVGERLARWTLAEHHGHKVATSGPLYTGYEIEKGQIRLTFDHVEGGLAAKGALKGFAIAGRDRKFVWAHAKIEGKTVVVRSDEIEHPLAVRYAWDMDPDCTLYNSAGLPASPFRTDNWQRSSE